eukprot:m.122861 g.122861  ORF g.122861 m.122861 type:complete len:52 (-) comp15661_c0_seq2:531-686(-)
MLCHNAHKAASSTPGCHETSINDTLIVYASQASATMAQAPMYDSLQASCTC